MTLGLLRDGQLLGTAAVRPATVEAVCLEIGEDCTLVVAFALEANKLVLVLVGAVAEACRAVELKVDGFTRLESVDGLCLGGSCGGGHSMWFLPERWTI